MKITQSYLTKNRCYTNAVRIKVRGLMLHSVGCPQPSAAVFMRQWDNPTVSVCVHGFVETSGEVFQCLPWDYKGWHGGGVSNDTHIGVEMTEPATIKYTGGASFVDNDPAKTKAHVRGTYKGAVELFAYLCGLYGLDPLRDIISHAEGHRLGIASNHGDPTHLWSKYPELGYTMDGFRADVQKKLLNESEENEMNTNELLNELTDISGTGDQPKAWETDAAAWAKENDLIKGDGNGNYGWDRILTVGRFVTILYRFYQMLVSLFAIKQ